MDNQSPYKYKEWINAALLEVIKKTIKTLEANGLHQDIHFYVTFNTTNSLVSIPSYLKQQYPEVMTIVLQNQFYDLITDSKGFTLTLTFSGKPEKLYISWNSIIQVLDPVSPISLKLDLATSSSEVHLHNNQNEQHAAGNNVIKFPKK